MFSCFAPSNFQNGAKNVVLVGFHLSRQTNINLADYVELYVTQILRAVLPA